MWDTVAYAGLAIAVMAILGVTPELFGKQVSVRWFTVCAVICLVGGVTSSVALFMM